MGGVDSFRAEANALSAPPGEYGRKAKLKGIDGAPHKQRSMWFNSTQREEPYLGLTCSRNSWKQEPSSERDHRWCMAVVSSCREMLG